MKFELTNRSINTALLCLNTKKTNPQNAKLFQRELTN